MRLIRSGSRSMAPTPCQTPRLMVQVTHRKQDRKASARVLPQHVPHVLLVLLAVPCLQGSKYCGGPSAV
jgi:hypothetical protein